MTRSKNNINWYGYFLSLILALLLGMGATGCSSSGDLEDSDDEEFVDEAEDEEMVADTDEVSEDSEDSEFSDDQELADDDRSDSEDETVTEEQPAGDDLLAEEAPSNEATSDYGSADYGSTDSSAPTTGAASTGGSEDYEIRGSDTLMKIAFEVYGDIYRWKEIYDANRDRIADPNRLSVGTVLRLQSPTRPDLSNNGEKYVIKRGDTLGKIAYEIYGTPKKWKKLWDNNRQLIQDPNRIYAGFFLYYNITPQEREEAERLKQMNPMGYPPIAKEPAPAVPAGASVDQGQGLNAPPPSDEMRDPAGFDGDLPPPLEE